MQKTLIIRGQSYAVDQRALVGDLNFIPIFAFTQDIYNPETKKKAATAIREVIPKIPETIVSDNAIALYADEWDDLISQIRLLWFEVNLETVQKLGLFKQEIRLAKGYAELQEQLNRDKQRKEQLGEDDDLTDSPLPPVNEKDVERLHFSYYEEEIQKAKELGNGDRLEQLTARLARLKDKSVNGQVLAVNSENEVLKKQVEDLKRQIEQKMAD